MGIDTPRKRLATLGFRHARRTMWADGHIDTDDRAMSLGAWVFDLAGEPDDENAVGGLGGRRRHYAQGGI